MHLPGFSAGASLSRTNGVYHWRPPTSELRQAITFTQDLGLTGYRMPESCTLAWLLCTLWQDPDSCNFYNTFPACNPCTVQCDEKCKPDPEVIDPSTGYGTMDCVDSHCAPFKRFCLY
jgi:hypothetical protein